MSEHSNEDTISDFSPPLDDEKIDYFHRPLSSLPEVPSVASVIRSQVNGSRSRAYEMDEDSAEELEITDGTDSVWQRDGRDTLNQLGYREGGSLRHSVGPRVGDIPSRYRYAYADVALKDMPGRKTKYDRVLRRRAINGERTNIMAHSPLTYDYWTLPRKRDVFRRSFENVDRLYNTPGEVLFPRKPISGRSGRKSHKHHQSLEEKRLHAHFEKRQVRQTEGIHRSAEDLNGTVVDTPHRSELKVYFRFSKGTLRDTGVLDYTQNEEYLAALQAHCRGWLTRQACEHVMDQDSAVRIIQRNADRMFNPWFRLLLAIRPLLKIQRTEEELYFLRSELERYKTLVKMLRFENAEYQAKVANLLQLIEQINTKGSESATVNELVQQISESLAKNQDFWQEMAAGNKALQSSALARPDCSTNTRSSPMLVPSPLTQLKRDADFYRNQVEMLKEEADEQQHRSSEHFQGQVSVLSDRVEQLQHLLSLEHDKVSRLSSELEGMNKTILEAKSHERSLEQTVSQLSRQLEQRDRAQAHEIKDVLRTADSPLTISDRNVDSEIQRDLERKLASYRRMIGELRAHLAKSPKAMHALANTPFQPGGEMDLFREPISVESGYTSIEPKLDQKFFAYPVQSEHESYASGGSTTPRSAFVQENAELKRQLAASENLLAETMEKMKNELEDREALESENKELNDRIAALNRQIRHKEEEYDEMINRKDVVCQRKLKELADQLEEETRAKSRLIQQTKELEKELTELRNVAEPDEDILNEEWETMRSKMRIDLAHYKRALEIVQDEYDQFRREHDPSVVHKQLAEKDERISLLEQEGQQRRTELEVLQVRLQNANSLLEESENRLKASIRERTAQQHRLTLVETERDEAIRKAANIEGRASAERENIASKLREIEELRVERDGLRRELMEVKQTLAGCQAETAADKRQLQVRLREMETYNEARITDFKAELDRAREELERLQLELQTVQASELEQKASNQQYRWKINELEDQLSHSLRRVSTLERRNTDLDAELTRAKADLSTSREVASLRKASQTRFAEEWLQYVGSEDTEDEDLNASFGDENSPLNSRVRRVRLYDSMRSSPMNRSNPAIYRPQSMDVRPPSLTERPSSGRISASLLDKGENHSFSSRHIRRPIPCVSTETADSKSSRTNIEISHEPVSEPEDDSTLNSQS